MTDQPSLLMLPPAPVINTDPSHPVLDDKFVSGMRFACANWPGRIDCLFRERTAYIPFGSQYTLSDLPFGVLVLGENAPVYPARLKDYDLVQISGDMHLDLDLPSLAKRQKLGRKTVVVIEYTLEARLQIIRLDRGASPLRKMKRTVWTLQQERRRRRAMRDADAVQANGYPAFEAYRRLNPDTLLYLDNRMRANLFATSYEMAARAARLSKGEPIRLINSGRLEPMKGAQDLAPFARALRERGISFTLDIYGSGSLETEIRDAISSAKLQEIVKLHAPVDFETELVPISRRDADLFLSLNRQSDPSCTYLEAMGCGLPVVGYDNRMLSRLVEVSQAGWTAPLGEVVALARTVAALKTNAETVRRAAEKALSYARSHAFETEFSKRNIQLIQMASR